MLKLFVQDDGIAFPSWSWRGMSSGKLKVKKSKSVKAFMFPKAKIISAYISRQSKARKSLQFFFYSSWYYSQHDCIYKMLNHIAKKKSSWNRKQLSNIFDSTSRTNVYTPQNLCVLMGVDMSSFRSVHCAGVDCASYTRKIRREPLI